MSDVQRRKKVLLPIALLGVGGVIVALLVLAKPEAEREEPQSVAPIVEVERLTPQRVEMTVRTQGTVVPRTESDLVPQVSGEIVWVSPALVSGGFFEEGETLVRLDRADSAAAVERARAAVARAESEEARSRRERERQQRLASEDFASQARIDEVENRYRAAEATLREARIALSDARRNLDRTSLNAPYAGRVRTENVDVGQFVTRGAPIATLYAVDYAEVRLPIPDRELGFLDVPLTYRPRSQDAKPDDAATSSHPTVHLYARFAGAEHRWTGEIVRTEGEIDPRSRMVTLVARVEDPYGDPTAEAASEPARPPLAVGLFVRADIIGSELESAFVLPRTALYDGDRLLVYEDGKLHFREVQIARVERDRIIVQSGVEPGEEICVTPLAQAVDGMAARRHAGSDAGVAAHEASADQSSASDVAVPSARVGGGA